MRHVGFEPTHSEENSFTDCYSSPTLSMARNYLLKLSKIKKEYTFKELGYKDSNLEYTVSKTADLPISLYPNIKEKTQLLSLCWVPLSSNFHQTDCVELQQSLA